MKITIDTKLKQIVIEDSVSINELNSFIIKNGYNDYTIVSKEKIESDKLREWFNSPQKWSTEITCYNKTNLPKFNPVCYGVETNTSFGNFSKKDL